MQTLELRDNDQIPPKLDFNPENYSILLIDDDPDQLEVLQALIRRKGYNVVVAHSGGEAISMTYHRYFDLIICDLKMPDYNGFDFIREMRAIPLIPSSHALPIIVLTACSSDIEFVALEAGADMFCEKRLAQKLLPAQIEFLLS